MALDKNAGRPIIITLTGYKFKGYENFGRDFQAVSPTGLVFSFNTLEADFEYLEDVREGDRVIDADGNWRTFVEDGWINEHGYHINDKAVQRPFKKQWRIDGTEVPQ